MRDDGRAAGHRLDHHEAKGFLPLDGKKKRGGVAQEFVLLRVIDGANPADTIIVDERLDFLGEITVFLRILWLAGEDDGHVQGLCDADGVERIFLHRHATEEGEVFPRLERRLIRIEVAAIVNRREFAPELQPGGVHLAVRDAVHRDGRPAAEDPFIIEMRTRVRGEKAGRVRGGGEREPRGAAVVVDHVELILRLEHFGHE